MQKKVLVIVGPTASGKSDLAMRLANKLNGEVISADSRQVYKGLDIGTGKVPRDRIKASSNKLAANSYLHKGVPHHLLDVADPKKQFTVSNFVESANQAITMIYHSDHLPIVTGGTGFYIDALVGTVSLPDVPPNKLLRIRLNKLSKEKLFEMLKKKDPARAKTIDPHNKVRLIRALEIVSTLGHVPTPKLGHRMSKYRFVFIGLKLDQEELDKRIMRRLLKRMPGMILEARRLRRQGLSWKRMHELGLEYRYLALYLQNKITKAQMIEELYREIRRYAKRQMTWFKRNKKIRWFESNQSDNIENGVRNMLR